MFLEDIIKANLKEVFIGYEVECSYCCKISRDADVFVDDVPAESMVEKLKEKVKNVRLEPSAVLCMTGKCRVTFWMPW